MTRYVAEKLYPLAFRDKLHSRRLGRLFIIACGKRYLVLVDDDSKKIYYASGMTKCREALEKIREVTDNIELYRDRIIYPR